MDTDNHWDEVKTLFRASFKSSFHYAIATVNSEGQPHVTPIGSLILTTPGQGFYFEHFPSALPDNLQENPRVCVLAVNSGLIFWLRSLIGGRFAKPPAVRLYGRVGDLREATDIEKARWLKRVRPLSFSRGHALLWRDMQWVRDIEFDCMEPVSIGKMTDGHWS